MNYWLFKTEPNEFSIDDLKRVRREPWTGVRNYMARNFLRDQCQPGDQVLIYHSSCEQPGVYGVGAIEGEAFADPTQFDPSSDYYDAKAQQAAPRWVSRTVRYLKHCPRPVLLSELRAREDLSELLLLKRGNRLSLFPISLEHFKVIEFLSEGKRR